MNRKKHKDKSVDEYNTKKQFRMPKNNWNTKKTPVIETQDISKGDAFYEIVKVQQHIQQI